MPEYSGSFLHNGTVSEFAGATRAAVICAAMDEIAQREDIAAGTTVALPTVPPDTFPSLIRILRL